MKKRSLFLLTLSLLTTCLATSCSFKERVVIFTAAEDERVAYLYDELTKEFPQYNIIFQTLGSGALVAKLRADQKNTDCDIFYDLEVTNAEMLIAESPDLFYSLDDYDLSIVEEPLLDYTKRHKRYALNSKVYDGIAVNTKMLEERNLPIPTSYMDLVDPMYKGLLSMPSPRSSGTGYCFYNGIMSELGEEAGREYFKKFNDNAKEFTTSGSAPLKSVVREDVAIAVGILWMCVDYSNEHEDIKVITPEDKLPYNLFTMGILNKRKINDSVFEVFHYLHDELNLEQNIRFNPDKMYVNQPLPLIDNYPTDIKDMKVDGIYDYKHKQKLLDDWKY